MSERQQVLAIAMLLGEKWGDCLYCRGLQETINRSGLKVKCDRCHGTGFAWLCRGTMDAALVAGHFSKLSKWQLPSVLIGA